MSLHHVDAPHKPLWPLDARDGVALTCALIALAVAALGGVGGGGVLLPIYILVLDFHLKEAVALANATILGGAIANVWFGSRKRHPYADRPLVAWDLILLFEPVVIFGSVLGSFANKLLPDVVLEIILVLLYGTLSYQTMSRAVQLVEEEGGWRYLCKRLPPTAMNSRAAPATPAHANPFNDTPTHVQATNDDRNESKNDVDIKTADESTPLCVTSPGSDDDASYHSASCTLDKDDSFYNLPPPNTPDSCTAKKEVMVRRLKCQERFVQWWKPAAMTLCFVGMAALRIGQKAVRCGSTS